MKILITGGLGFIGSNLTEYLLTKTNVKKIINVVYVELKSSEHMTW